MIYEKKSREFTGNFSRVEALTLSDYTYILPIFKCAFPSKSTGNQLNIVRFVLEVLVTIEPVIKIPILLRSDPNLARFVAI